MAEVEIKLRYNPEDETVELVVGDEVVGDSGKAEFESWVDAHNAAHPEKFEEPEPTEEERAVSAAKAEAEAARHEVEDLKAQLEVANAAAAEAPAPEVDTADEA